MSITLPTPTIPAVTPKLRWQNFLPGLHTLFTNQPGRWRSDLIASITLAAYLIPAGIGDASLAGLPAEAGLYACLFSGLLFWIFASSKHTSITVTSAISLLIGTSLGELANGDATRFWALASCTALLTSGVALLAWIFRAGVLVNFISETVMVGFKIGVAIYILGSQLPKLFGFKGSHGNVWERFAWFFSHLYQTQPLALLVGGSALAVLLAGKFLLKNRPVAMVVMIAAILVASFANLGDRGVKLLGRLPQGLPAPSIPEVQPADLNDLLPLAFACFLLAAVETAAIGRTFALRHGYRLNANQEFLALAAANLASGLGRGYPVSGGMSQSLVNESAGARSALSGLLAAGLIILVLLFASGILRNLPEPVVAAIVLSAVAGLLNFAALKRLWQFDRWEFAIAAVAILGVLDSGLLRGVLIGAILSLIVLLRRGSRPNTAELGRLPGTHYFADLARHPEAARIPDLFIFRADASLLYLNVDFIRDRFTELLNQRTTPPKLAIFSLGAVPMIDLAGAELLVELHASLKKRNITFHIAEVRDKLRDSLRNAGFESHCGPIQSNQTLSELLTQLPSAPTAQPVA